MKQDLLNLYYVDMKYIRELHKIDDNVMSVSPQIGKSTRPFLGVVIIMETKKYCIPLTSPQKDKFKGKSKEDFIKIPDSKCKDEHGAPKTIGILNLNNMIPVSDKFIQKVDLSTATEFNRNLLINELRWCRDNLDIISNRANKLYNKVTLTPEKDRNLTRRCCDFKKLELVLEKWIAKTETLNTPEASAQMQAANEKCNAILNANPELKGKLNLATVEYCRKHNLNLPDSSLPADKRYEMRNAILNENPNLKAEYIKAKKAFEQKQGHTQSNNPKPKLHR